MHKEDIVQREPKEWDQRLRDLLEQLQELYERLDAGSRTLRTALVKLDHSQTLKRVKEIQNQIATLRGHEKSLADFLRAYGLLADDESLVLPRVGAHPRLAPHPGLQRKIAALARVAERAGGQARLNHTIIERLSAWNRKEFEIITQPLTQSAGYGAAGQVGCATPRPAVIDRRG